ncbi:MAG: endospore germination permease [Clostridiaceae bacterium]|nr:endospore germination permease [Clostridiaceae bacterium]
MIKKNQTDVISVGQIYIMIISMMVGTGVLNLSRTVAEVSKQDGWISVLLAGVLITTLMGIMIFVTSRFGENSFLQYTSYLLSKPVGYLVAFLYGIYATLLTSIVVRFLCELIITWFLPRTPIYVVSFIIVITIVNITKNGLTNVARFNEIMVFAILPLVFLIFLGIPETSILNLRPVGGVGFSKIAEGIVPSFYAFSGYEVVLILYPFIDNKNKSLLKGSMLSVFSVTILYTATVASQLALFGFQEINRMLYPSIHYLNIVETVLLERVEVLFSIFWLFSVIGTITIQYLAGCIVMQSIFHTKGIHLYTYILAPIIYILSIYPENSVKVVEYSDKIGKMNIFFGIVLPILLLLMYLMRGKRSNYEQKM